MRMRAHHRVRTRIDHELGQALLTRGGIRLIFNTPVHERNHHIGMVHFTSSFDVGDHLLVIAPSRARTIHIGLKTAGEKFVVSQDGNGDSLALKKQRLMRLLQISPTAEKRHLGLGQKTKHLGKCSMAEIARVVVCQ